MAPICPGTAENGESQLSSKCSHIQPLPEESYSLRSCITGIVYNMDENNVEDEKRMADALTRLVDTEYI